MFEEVGQSGSSTAQGVLLILCAQSGIVSNRLKDIIDTNFNAPKYAVCIFNDVLKLGSGHQIPADSKQKTLKKGLLTPKTTNKINNKEFNDTHTKSSAFSDLPGIEDFLPGYFKKEEDCPEKNKAMYGEKFRFQITSYAHFYQCEPDFQSVGMNWRT